MTHRGAAAWALALIGLSGTGVVAQGPGYVPLHRGDTVARTVSSAIVHESGTGAARLYVAGYFELPGVGTATLIRWGSGGWEAVPGIPDYIASLAAIRENGVEVLYAVAAYNANRIYRYDGTSWSVFAGPDVIPGWDAQSNVGVVMFDSTGVHPESPKLHVLIETVLQVVSGSEVIGGLYAREDKRWSLVRWNVPVGTMAVYDPDGTGPAPADLYIAGHWGYWNGQYAFFSGGIARCAGGSWPLIANMHYPLAMASFDQNGDGHPLLWVGGSFQAGDGVPTSRVAAWDGQRFVQLATGLSSGEVDALTVFDADGPGPQRPVLLAAGSFSRLGGDPADGLAAWDGGVWSEFGGGLTKPSASGDLNVSVLQGLEPGIAGRVLRCCSAPMRGWRSIRHPG